jgi:endoglucanase
MTATIRRRLGAHLCASQSWARRLAQVVVVFLPLVCGLAPAIAGGQNVTIRGRDFFLEGKLWLPKGVKVEVFNRPVNLSESKDTPAWLIKHPENRSWWNTAELQATRTVFGASVLRFAVSQPGLDPKSPIYDPTYKAEVVKVTYEARAGGFVAILSMDDQDENGMIHQPCMPGDGAVRAWKNLAPEFTHEGGVMFEVFDEPCKMDTPEAHTEWAADMQPLIDAIRGAGAANILLIDGLGWARFTDGLFPLVHDPLKDRMALAIHPYLVNSPTYANEAQWQAKFGADAQKYPMIASEWNATPKAGCAGKETPERAASLLRYLAARRIGLIGWAIDTGWPTLVKSHENFEPTDFSGFADCKDGSNSGGGKLLAAYPDH